MNLEYGPQGFLITLSLEEAKAVRQAAGITTTFNQGHAWNFFVLLANQLDNLEKR